MKPLNEFERGIFHPIKDFPREDYEADNATGFYLLFTDDYITSCVDDVTFDGLSADIGYAHGNYGPSSPTHFCILSRPEAE